MEAYQSEKKFQEILLPKLTVDLDEAVAVEILSERKNFFYIEMTDGVMCLFEAKTIGEAQEWKSCLNAVLLVRGPEGGECVCVCVCVCGCLWLNVCINTNSDITVYIVTFTTNT